MASAQLQNFLISFMPFERESFVPVCTSLIFVCTSKGSEIQRVSKFAKFAKFAT